MLEIRLVNFYVCSNVVAILLPCYYCLISYKINHKSTLIHSWPMHCRIHRQIFFPVCVQTDQEGCTSLCVHQISHRAVGQQKKKLHFFGVRETHCWLCCWQFRKQRSSFSVHCIEWTWLDGNSIPVQSRSRQVAVTVLLMPATVDTVIWAPDDGWRYHPKHVERFTDINTLYIVASCWTVIGIYFTMHGPLCVKKKLKFVYESQVFHIRY